MRGPTTLVTLLAVLAAGVGAVTGCGSQQPSQRPATARYIKQVGRVETALAVPLAAVTQAGVDFAQAQSGHATVLGRLAAGSAPSTLLQAWGQIESLRRELADIPAPPAVTRLRSLLLELIDLQARTTREMALLVAFVPRFALTLRPLGSATQRLELALSQRSAYGAAAVAAAYAAKAAALRDFQASVDAVANRLRRLRPPAVSKPGYRAQLAALTGMSTDAGKLASSLANGPQGNVGRLLSSFDHAALSTQSEGVQKAQIAAVRAYDAQSDEMAAVSAAIDRERVRLVDTLR
jgi:hypothetical protein